MNAYFCFASPREVLVEYIQDVYPRYEIEMPCACVVAPTRNAAKYIFHKNHYFKDYVEYHDVRTRKLCSDAQEPPREIGWDDAEYRRLNNLVYIAESKHPISFKEEGE